MAPRNPSFPVSEPVIMPVSKFFVASPASNCDPSVHYALLLFPHSPTLKLFKFARPSFIDVHIIRSTVLQTVWLKMSLWCSLLETGDTKFFCSLRVKF